jgi:hypothetical protein
LILSEELPAASAHTERTEPSEIGSRIDALFGQDSAATEGVSADQEPELLDVDELLAEDGPPAAASPAETLGDDLQLDLDLGLSLEEDAAEQGPAAGVSVDSGSDAPDIDFNLDLESPGEAASKDTLASLDELGINLEGLEALEDAATPGAAAGLGAAERADLELDLDLNALGSESVKDQASELAEAELKEDLVDMTAGLSAGSAAPDVTAAGQPPGESELDLSDLERLLEGEVEGLEAKTFGVVEGVDLELETGAAAPDGYEKAGELEELDLTPIAGETVLAADAAVKAGEPKAENPRVQQLAKRSRSAFDEQGQRLPKGKCVGIRDALFEAILDRFHEDPTLVAYGEENRDWGGAFGVYRGLTLQSVLV